MDKTLAEKRCKGAKVQRCKGVKVKKKRKGTKVIIIIKRCKPDFSSFDFSFFLLLLRCLVGLQVPRLLFCSTPTSRHHVVGSTRTQPCHPSPHLPSLPCLAHLPPHPPPTSRSFAFACPSSNPPLLLHLHLLLHLLLFMELPLVKEKERMEEEVVN